VVAVDLRATVSRLDPRSEIAGYLTIDENELISLAMRNGAEAQDISNPSHVSKSLSSLRMISGAGGFA